MTINKQRNVNSYEQNIKYVNCYSYYEQAYYINKYFPNNKHFNNFMKYFINLFNTIVLMNFSM